MDAATWTAIAVLAGAVFGAIFWLGSRIDGLGTRIDGLGTRIDAQSARIDRLSEQVAGLAVELRTHLRPHAS